jgi:hypothetical protein
VKVASKGGPGPAGEEANIAIVGEQGETLDMPVVGVEKLKLVSKHS